MSDPLSISASVVGILSFGIQVTQGIFNYYDAFRSQHSDVDKILDKIHNLLDLLDQLKEHLTGQRFRQEDQRLVKSIEESIDSCGECIAELDDELNKFKEKKIEGIFAAARTTTRRLAYPFRKGTLQNLEEDVNSIAKQITQTLGLLQSKGIERIQGQVEDVKALLDFIRATQVDSSIQRWLKAPDATTNLNDNCKKKHPRTGLWLTKGDRFESWLQQPKSFLWLVGFAGCGKSVLCSTAIQYAFRHRQSSPCIGVACFFFTFNDSSKQSASAMLRALVLQLSSQLKDDQHPLARLHKQYGSSSPTDEALLDCLCQLVRLFQDVYILVDALDESPRGRLRSDVLQIIRDIRTWSEPGLHVLVTSRDEVDIQDELDASIEERIPMKNVSIDQDIQAYVSEHLWQNRRLRKWKDHFGRIQKELSQRAQGVFRWVECQFKAIEDCPQSEDMLNRVLKSLPETLDGTYERMLLNIPSPARAYAQRLLLLLCCAKRPLTLDEVIDGIAVEIEPIPKYNERRRLGDAAAVQELCPGLIAIKQDWGEENVRIAHFSVQEYLESDRILGSKAKTFAIIQEEAQTQMARVCMTIVLELSTTPAESHRHLAKHKVEFQIAEYARENWLTHFQKSNEAPSAQIQAIAVLQTALYEQTCFPMGFVRGNNIGHYLIGDTRRHQPPYNPKAEDVGNGLQFASYHGLEECVRTLLLGKIDVNATMKFVGTALQASSKQGFTEIVRLLLDHGADVNKVPEVDETPLSEASEGGHVCIVRMLLKHGANAHATNYGGETPLHFASKKSNAEVVQLLLEAYADANASDKRGWTPLHNASRSGFTEIVRLLLEAGADTNASDNVGDTPLMEASREGHLQVVKCFLRHEAAKGVSQHVARSEHTATQPTRRDITQGPARVVNIDTNYARALLVAAEHGNSSTVDFLLRQGQDVNTVDCHRRSALSHAAGKGHKDVIEVLLNQSGCDVDPLDYDGRSPLLYAARGGHTDVVEVLLQKGHCNVDCIDRDGRSPLLYAARGGHTDVVEVLLQKGHCNVDCIDRDGRSPLSYAVKQGPTDIAVMLLREGRCDTSLIDWDGRSPLSFFAEKANESQSQDAVEALLKTGRCDVNLADQDEAGWTPFLWAVTSGPWKERSIAQQLFDTGKVDLSWQSDHGLCQQHFLTALQRERLETVHWFLQSGLVHSELLDGEGQTLLSRTFAVLMEKFPHWDRITERQQSWIYETLNYIWNPELDGTNSKGERFIPQTLLGWANDRGHIALTRLIARLRSKGRR